MEHSLKRSGDVQHKPIASLNGSPMVLNLNHDHASLIPCSLNDAAANNEEVMVIHPIVHQRENDNCRIPLKTQDKPKEDFWLCKPCMDTTN